MKFTVSGDGTVEVTSVISPVDSTAALPDNVLFSRHDVGGLQRKRAKKGAWPFGENIRDAIRTLRGNSQ